MAAPAPALSRLARHLVRPVPPAVRDRARLHLLDWLACVAGARQSAACRSLRAHGTSPLVQASTIGNLLEMDDVHRAALLHPGPVIWPVMVQSAGGSIDDRLDAAVRGYEAMIAVGATFDAHHYAHWHPTATAGIVGAAAAAVTSATADVDIAAHAMALAASVSGGVWQTRHSDNLGKSWHVAHAVDTGIAAARHAQAGMTGPLDVIEGEQGVHAAMCREPRPMVLTGDWRIAEVSFKPWAACRHAHAAIDCALALRAQGALQPPFVVETYRDAIAFCDRPDPVTDRDAKFSLQHAVAVIADGRDATPADFTPDAIRALAPIRAQVTVREDKAMTARYPAHFGARVNGCELVDTRGDPERPVSEADIIAKMHMLASWGGLPAAEADHAVRLALHGNDVNAIARMIEGWLR